METPTQTLNTFPLAHFLQTLLLHQSLRSPSINLGFRPSFVVELNYFLAPKQQLDWTHSRWYSLWPTAPAAATLLAVAYHALPTFRLLIDLIISNCCLVIMADSNNQTLAHLGLLWIFCDRYYQEWTFYQLLCPKAPNSQCFGRQVN